MPRQPLGTLIFQKGLLTAEQLLEALEEGHRSRRRLGDILLERGWLDESALAETLAEQYGLPLVDLQRGDVDPEAARLIPAHDSERLEAIVVRIEDGAPLVAVADPSNAAAVAELETMLGPEVLFAVGASTRVSAAIRGVFAESGQLAVPDELVVSDGPTATAAVEELDSQPAEEPAEAASKLLPAAVAPRAPVAVEESVPQSAEDSAEEFDSLPAEKSAEAEPEWLAAADAPSAPEAVEEFDSERAEEAVEAAPVWPPAADAPSAPVAVEDLDSEPAEALEAASEWPPAADAPSAPVAVEGSDPQPAEESAEAEPPAFAGVEPEAGDAVDEAQEPHEAQDPADDLSWAFAAVTEPLSAALGGYEGPAGRETIATHDSVMAMETDLNGHGRSNVATASVVVLRLANGDTVELGSFADHAHASSRAVELIEQLIADEAKGWTEIEGSYFRLQAIIAIDVVPA